MSVSDLIRGKGDEGDEAPGALHLELKLTYFTVVKSARFRGC